MLKQRFLLVLLVILAGAFFVQAQETIRVGEPISGELAAGEVLEYQLEAKAGDRLLITLSSDEFDTVVTMFGTDGFELARNDDGGQNTNSVLRGLEIPQDGVYTVQVESFSDTVGGAFELLVAPFEASDITLGEPATVTMEAGMQTAYFAYEATAGEVVDIVVDSGGTLDTLLEVISPFGYVVNQNDDAGDTVDPGLSQIVLDSEGTYYLALSPAKPNAVLNGDVTITIAGAALPSLDDGPIDLVYGDDELYAKAMVFEATAGETVRLTFVIDSEFDWASPFYSIQQGDTELAYFNHSGVSTTSVELEIPQDGTVQVTVEAYSDMTINVVLGRNID